jgi:hypothetical protein
VIRDWIASHRRETLAGLLLVGVLIALTVLTAPIIAAGLVAVGVPALGWLVLNPEQAEKWGGRLLESASLISSRAERTGISAEMQGVINNARNQLQEELPDVLPLGVRVRFVRNEQDLATLRDGEVVISLRHPGRRAENTAKATLAYVSAATIKPARAYVGRQVMSGVDYSLTKRILKRADPHALDYFLTEVWEPAMHQTAELREICDEVERVERRGLLTRVLLAEYLELGRRLYGEFPSPTVHAEARAFLAHLARVASRSPDDRFPLGFRRGHIRIGVVLAGERERAEREGARPYVRACQWHIKNGADAVYVLGRGARRAVVETTASEMERDGRVLTVDVAEYVEERDGDRVAAMCARILVDSRRAPGPGLSK